MKCGVKCSDLFVQNKDNKSVVVNHCKIHEKMNKQTPQIKLITFSCLFPTKGSEHEIEKDFAVYWKTTFLSSWALGSSTNVTQCRFNYY